MKSQLLLKTTLLLCAPLLWLSCSSWEEVVAPDEFKSLKIVDIYSDGNEVGSGLVITGKNIIQNKAYMQVWFGGNLRGVIDTVVGTKLYLKVPSGAKTGRISISNGIYSDTSLSTFEVIESPPFRTITISFNGLKVIRNNSSRITERSGTSTTTSTTDSNSILNNKYLSNYRAVTTNTFMFNCHFSPYISYSYNKHIEGIYQSLTFGTRTVPIKYTTVKFDIDSVNRMLDTFSLTQYGELAIDNGQQRDCYTLSIDLKNVPYKVLNGKKVVTLNAAEIGKYISKFSESSETNRYSSGGDYYYYSTYFNKIYQLLPDAYFELTLE